MTARRELVLVVLLFALAIAWNGIGLARLLPYAPEPDNYVAVQLADLEAGTPVAERVDKFRSYPLLMANLARLVPVSDPNEAANLEDHLRTASDVSIRARIVALLLASLLGPATYLLARRFLSWPAALAAALFASTSLLHQLFASQGRPHGPHVALGVLAVLAALRVRRDPSWRSYLLAGAATAAASVTLQTGYFTLLSLFLAHHIAERRPGRWLRLAAALAIVFLAAWICMPEAPAAPQEVGLTGTMLRIGSHYFELRILNGRGYGDCIAQLWMHDPVLLVVAGLGIASALPAWKRWQKDPDVCVVAAHGLFYAGIWGTYGWTYDRYWLPLVPYLAILAASFLARAGRLFAARIRAEWAARAALGAVCAVVFALPAWASLGFARLRAEPDTIELAARFIEEELDPSSSVLAVTPQLNLPLWYTASALSRDPVPKLSGDWVRYQRRLPDGARGSRRYEVANLAAELATDPTAQGAAELDRWLAELAPTHLVYESTGWSRNSPVIQRLYARAREHGTLLHASADLGEGHLNRRTDAYQRVLDCVQRVLTLDRLGSRIEIWQFPPREH